ncbi:hotdog fold thioesterase [Pararoseomonas sp. SCSIO 73927]|uniref:PaaI family thioesterase n=1 Tax=Pararoseomonas sp. SCSIO 73927 TaxID=3114537 RepID=UPI0030CC6287
MSTPIWKKSATPEILSGRAANTAISLLGIQFTEVGPDFLRATMPVDHRHVQPWRVLHGGISVVLSETLGSAACYMAVPEGFHCVGLEINANHIAAVPEGQVVVAECRPFHIGRSTQVWQTEIRRADGRLACVSRITCAVLPD